MKRSSGLPFTDEERAIEAAHRKLRLDMGVRRRRAIKSGQRYNVPGNPERKARDARIMGEDVDNDPEASLSTANHTASESSR